MPSGTYTIVGDDGSPVGTETFRCAPGPMGWRYVSEIETTEHGPHRETVDVAVDAAWRIARFRVATGAHELQLERDGDRLTGVRDGDPLDVPFAAQTHLDYLTPATNLITTRRLPDTAEVDVVFVEPYTLVPSRERQRYERGGEEPTETPVGTFAATRWGYTSLASGWSSDLWVAGDVIVRYDRIFELVAYEPGANGPRPVGRASG
jgi:Putative glycolipid-binding